MDLKEPISSLDESLTKTVDLVMFAQHPAQRR